MDIQQYRLNSRNAQSHRWYLPAHFLHPKVGMSTSSTDFVPQKKRYYYPRMSRDEVVLFKQWDSDTSRCARAAFHSAFSDPSVSRHFVELALFQQAALR